MLSANRYDDLVGEANYNSRLTFYTLLDSLPSKSTGGQIEKAIFHTINPFVPPRTIA
jgi:hypothetical protein